MTIQTPDYQKYKAELLEIFLKEKYDSRKVLWKPWTWFRKYDSAKIFTGDKVFTMSQILDEIRNDTEIGKDLVEMHKSLKETRKKLGIK
jgi:hypothetical protein